jgi:hypothetical protein
VTTAAAPLPGVRSAIRGALSDVYFHSVRLVPANLVWGLGFIVVISLVAGGATVIGVVLLPLLSLPLVAIARLAGEIVRGEHVALADGWQAVRELAGSALVAGTLVVAASGVLVYDIAIGLTAGTAPALAMAVLAGWGLVALWLLALPFWVLLADPARRGLGALAAARGAVGLLLVEPRRLIGSAVVVSVVLLLATVLVAALLAVAVAYAALVTARVVLPAADRLDGSPGFASLPD